MKTKKMMLSGLFISVFICSLASVRFSVGPCEIQDGSEKSRGEPQMNAVRAPIYINGNEDLNEANGVVSGDGSEADPFLIENWVINDSDKHAIHILNTDAHILIRNCEINYAHSGFFGIVLEAVENVLVDNNDLFGLSYGVWVSNSINNTIRRNTIDTCGNNAIAITNATEIVIELNHLSETWCAIQLINSNQTIITNNILIGNTYGVILENSHQNSIARNKLNEDAYINNEDGIVVFEARNNTITDNLISFYETGILLTLSINNLLQRNQIIMGFREGIKLDFSPENTIKNNNISVTQYAMRIYNSDQNLIEKNTLFGESRALELSTSYNNIIWNNNFLYNRWGLVYLEDYTSNWWYHEETGNYWGDYQIRYPNAHNDGRIWNIAYEIEGETDDSDPYPLVQPSVRTTERTELDYIDSIFAISGFPITALFFISAVGALVLIHSQKEPSTVKLSE